MENVMGEPSNRESVKPSEDIQCSAALAGVCRSNAPRGRETNLEKGRM